MMRIDAAYVDRVIDRAMRGERITRAEVLAISLLWDCEEPQRPTTETFNERLSDPGVIQCAA